jgi:pyroglutamyl-peptidase
MTQLLLTSFTTWLPHQKSNAADDLLLELMQTPLPPTVHFLRQLPVDFVLAPQQAIAQIQQLQPNCVICCGMAESRTKLSVESRAVSGDRVLHTCFDLPQLVAELPMTEISHDAGRFVCNTTYYKVLEHLQDSPGRGLFVHVPILTAINRKRSFVTSSNCSCEFSRLSPRNLLGRIRAILPLRVGRQSRSVSRLDR